MEGKRVTGPYDEAGFGASTSYAIDNGDDAGDVDVEEDESIGVVDVDIGSDKISKDSSITTVSSTLKAAIASSISTSLLGCKSTYLGR